MAGGPGRWVEEGGFPPRPAPVRERRHRSLTAAPVAQTVSSAGTPVAKAAAPVTDAAKPVASAVTPPLTDAAEDRIEVVVADEERVVLRSDLRVGLVVIERDAVAGLDHEEGPEPGGSRQTEDLREERRRGLLVAAPHDGVVELHAHAVVQSFPSTVSSTRSL